MNEPGHMNDNESVRTFGLASIFRLLLVSLLTIFAALEIKTQIEQAVQNVGPIHGNVQSHATSDEVQKSAKRKTCSDSAIDEARNFSARVDEYKAGRRILKYNEPRFSIQWDGGYQGYLDGIVSETIKKAHRRIGSDLNHYPEPEITVVLYLKYNIRDAAKASSWRPPPWVPAIYDGKIRIRIENPSDTSTLQRALIHEYTHVVVDSITQGNCPTWLHEGLAMYEEGVSEAEIGHILALAIKHNALIPLSSLGGSFIVLGENQAQLAYTESISAVEYLIDAYGLDKVREILELLSTNSSMDFALRKAINLGYSEFEDEWQEKLIRKYKG